MKIAYLGREGLDMTGSDSELSLFTPWARESYLIELPRLSKKDAESAAVLKARDQYPGRPEGLAIASQIFEREKGLVALVHVARGGGDRRGLCPQDFVTRPKSRGRYLYLFFTEDWAEWLLFSDGHPERIGAVERGNWEEGNPHLEDGGALDGFTAWCPAAMKKEIEGLLAGSAFRPSSPFLFCYEDQAEFLLRKGWNSFGKRRRRESALIRILAIAIVVLDLALLVLLFSRGLIAEGERYAELKKERDRLSVLMAETARAKAELDILVGEARPANSSDPYRLLGRLLDRLPQGVIIYSADLEIRSFRLVGQARDAYGLVPALERSGLFEDITLEQASPLEGGGGMKFSLSGRLADD